jgi:hypothetical protein
MKAISITACLVITVPAFAEEPSPIQPDAAGNQCLYAGKSFSIGSSIRIGDNVFTCSGERGTVEWSKAESDSKANCLYKDSYYTPGSIMSFPSAKIVMRCGADGTWSRLNTTDAGNDI